MKVRSITGLVSDTAACIQTLQTFTIGVFYLKNEGRDKYMIQGLIVASL